MRFSITGNDTSKSPGPKHQFYLTNNSIYFQDKNTFPEPGRYEKSCACARSTGMQPGFLQHSDYINPDTVAGL